MRHALWPPPLPPQLGDLPPRTFSVQRITNDGEMTETEIDRLFSPARLHMGKECRRPLKSPLPDQLTIGGAVDG